jgi:hypothetical protein
VLKLPSLSGVSHVHCSVYWLYAKKARLAALTPGPYGDCPFSSLLCRTLWKSYLFSWRTKLAKLLCLKCLGRMCFVNFSFCPGVCQRIVTLQTKIIKTTYFQYYKAVSIIPPSHYVLVGRVFEHSVPIISVCRRIAWIGSLRTCTVCAPALR